MITPVLLCGGAGTRLWPVSRKSLPKQFVPLLGAESLFQGAARRLSGDSFGTPVVVTAEAFRFVAAEQLEAVGVEPRLLLVEPEGRDTAPAVLAAALEAARRDPGALLLAAPTDHLIPDAARLKAAVAAGVPAAEAGRIVAFGVAPDRPETGYGYLELDAPVDWALAPAPLALRGFVEKPGAERAAALLAGGRHLWNAGLFLFRADAMLAAARLHAPDLLGAVEEAVAGARRSPGLCRLAREPWARAPAVSIDRAVMERAGNLSAVPFGGCWSDLGDWAAVWREGDAARGPVTAIDCEGTLLRAEGEGQRIVGIGLTDIVAVAMPDAVLVARRDRAQDVRAAVAALAAQGAPEAGAHPRDHRPWGRWDRLAGGDGYQVKRLVVRPGGRLSLQSHRHRAEHWVVVEGVARVTLEGEARPLTVGQSAHVPLGAVHRLENPGNVPLVLIEVQTGAYLGEDDIRRYEDAYARA